MAEARPNAVLTILSQGPLRRSSAKPPLPARLDTQVESEALV